MSTEVFESYDDFCRRPDRSVNGRLPGDPDEPGANNCGCWRCSHCSNCFGCSDCFGCRYCSDCFGCRYCRDCSDCFGCRYCSDCFDCDNCSDCSDCFGCSGSTPEMNNTAPGKYTPSSHAKPLPLP